MTAANTLARAGHSRAAGRSSTTSWAGWPPGSAGRGGHIFDVALHGFPVGMIKSCRRYWSSEIADSIVQLKDIRFDNPMFSLSTTFDRQDFTRLLVERFRVPAGDGRGVLRRRPEHELLRRSGDSPPASCSSGSFPAADDVVRLLMEPITYANGSTLEDPALTYGIVFSNFMSKGVYTFQGGTDRLIGLMRPGTAAKRRRCPHPLRRREDPRRRPPRRRRDRRRPARSRPARSSPTPICWARSSTWSAPSIGTPISSSRPGRCG